MTQLDHYKTEKGPISIRWNMGESPSTREEFYYVSDAQVTPTCLENCPVGLANFAQGWSWRSLAKGKAKPTHPWEQPSPGHPGTPVPAYRGLVSPGIREQEFVGIRSLLLQLWTFISPDKYSSNLYIKIFQNLPSDSDLNPVMQMNLSHFCPIHNGFGNKAICVNQLFLWINISNPFSPPL